MQLLMLLYLQIENQEEVPGLKSVKFLHCSDIHFDAPFSSLGSSGGKSSIRRQDLREAFDKVIGTAASEKADIILLGGDLYEHSYVRKSTIDYINEKFGQIPHIKVFIVSGNHDPYAANSYYVNYPWNKNVYILNDKNPYIKIDELDTCIYGMGFSSFYREKPQLDGFNNISSQCINIMLLHGTVDLSLGQNQYNPVKSCDIAALGMDYVALGHFHNRIDNIGGYGNIYNPGSLEPLGFDEPGEHGIYMGAISKNEYGNSRLDISFKKMNKRFYRSLDVDISNCSTDQQVIYRIKSMLESRNCTNDILQITLKGRVERGFKADTGLIGEYFIEDVFCIKIKNEAAEDFDFEYIMMEPGIRGIFVRKMMNLINGTRDGHRKRLLVQSLYYGMEALEKGKIEI